LVGLEGGAGLTIGIFLVAAPDTAASTIRWLLGFLLLGVSLSDTLNGFRTSRDPMMTNAMTPYLLVRGGAGLMLAVVFLLATRSEYLSDADARYLLGVGMIGYAIIGLIGYGESLVKGQMNWSGILGNLLFMLMGTVLVYNGRNDGNQEDQMQLLGWSAIVGGFLIMAYAIVLRRQEEASLEPEAMLSQASTVPASLDLDMPFSGVTAESESPRMEVTAEPAATVLQPEETPIIETANGGAGDSGAIATSRPS
jgi:drug/metabolite transporter (DMT)-like permease